MDSDIKMHLYSTNKYKIYAQEEVIKSQRTIIQTLQSNYDDLKYDYDNLKIEYGNIKDEYNYLENEYMQIKKKHDLLNEVHNDVRDSVNISPIHDSKLKHNHMASKSIPCNIAMNIDSNEY